MFLSAIQDGFDSILCSALFDASIPCNLLGASSLGIKKAISTANELNSQLLLNAIESMNPHLIVLWTAAVCNGQANSVLNMTLDNLPPMCLPTAFITNTIQSFLQIDYCLEGLPRTHVSRALEFQTSFFCRPDISLPWSPAPPFGTTPVQNLSLEVRSHSAHQHYPLSWTICWLLDTEERTAVSQSHRFVPLPIHQMRGFSPARQASE